MRALSIGIVLLFAMPPVIEPAHAAGVTVSKVYAQNGRRIATIKTKGCR